MTTRLSAISTQPISFKDPNIPVCINPWTPKFCYIPPQSPKQAVWHGSKYSVAYLSMATRLLLYLPNQSVCRPDSWKDKIVAAFPIPGLSPPPAPHPFRNEDDFYHLGQIFVFTQNRALSFLAPYVGWVHQTLHDLGKYNMCSTAQLVGSRPNGSNVQRVERSIDRKFSHCLELVR